MGMRCGGVEGVRCGYIWCDGVEGVCCGYMMCYIV